MKRRSFFTRCFGALAACVAPAAVKDEPKINSAVVDDAQHNPDEHNPTLIAWSHEFAWDECTQSYHWTDSAALYSDGTLP